jgi:hypothetical protein
MVEKLRLGCVGATVLYLMAPGTEPAGRSAGAISTVAAQEMQKKWLVIFVWDCAAEVRF